MNYFNLNNKTMENNQTAVEWLEDEINKRGPKENNPPQWLKELYEQAKSMEKEQIKNAFWNGDNSDCTSEQNSFEFAEKYYKETYGRE